MMKKRLLALLLALSMLAALTACGGEKAPEEEETKEPVQDVTPEAEPESENAPVEEPETDEPENLPADPEEKPEVNDKPADPAQKPESTPVQKPVENVPSVPAETPTEKPDENQGVDLGAFYESVASSTADWPAMMALEGEMLDVYYPGLSAISTKYCGVYMPMMSSVVCEIALVEVENAADIQAVKDILQARISYQVGDETNPGGAWYPESIEGWKNDSRVVANGNCVMMVAFAGADAIVDSFNALFA